MSLLIVTAAASPLFGDFLMVVSVTSADGEPVKGLKVANFKIYEIASLNHAFANQRQVSKVTESPGGFYIVSLKKNKVQPTLPEGHYVLGVIVTSGKNNKGQTVATGDMVI
ncbi:MAG TPA: hypothetical protein VGQ09_20270 [Chitinophagaceae bacterium]|jgi:hypothetical protein|nr:hypothetical protein [Chitinophagaceae bacterium]